MPVEILKELIKIPSVYGNEKEIADFTENFIKSYNPNLKVYRENNSIIATTPSDKNKPTVALVGHLDTVPGENERTGQIIDGKLYGLGASDMKAGDAVILKIISDLKNKTPNFNLTFIFYEKEEGPYENNGLKLLISKFPQIIKSIDFAFVLEPTDNKIQVGCLGVIHAWFIFKGKRAHSARPWEGDNAIHKGWKLLKLLNEYKPKEYRVENLSYFEVMNATMVDYKGGRNIIPEEFRININYRFTPEKKPEDAVKILQSLAQKSGTSLIKIWDISPAAKPCTDNPIFKSFKEKFNLPVEAKQAWTDVAQLSEIGVDAVNFGPGQPHQAHQKNEYVETEKVNQCYQILKSFLLK